MTSATALDTNAPAAGSARPGAGAAAPGAAPRGFVIDRADGLAQLPGSLHTNRRLSQWLAFPAPDVVHVHTGKAELGQGILTALRLIAAEELDVDPQAVTVLSASTVRGPDEGVTSGSLSIQDSGGALRHACAEVRGIALQRAAQRAGVAPQSLRVEGGRFIAADGAVVGDYWSVLEAADLQAEFTGLHAPKVASNRRRLGRESLPRVDLPDKVFGRARFVHDLRLPDLLHGRVVRGPRRGEPLTEGAQAVLREMQASAGVPGLRCWADGRFVAVVAEREADADAMAERLRARLSWVPASAVGGSASDDKRSAPASVHPDEIARFLEAAPCEQTVTARRGETDFPAGGRRFSARYFKPYLAHASIGPSCAIARWDGQALEVWTHSQGIHNLRDDIVLALSGQAQPVPREAITVHHVEGAGCYGHNGADDVAFDAVLMALRCPGRPVRVQWSRADELAHSPFGAAQSVALDARVDDSGRITHWRHVLWANGYSSRPGRAKTPTLLAASEREGGTALPLPINPPLAAGGGADRNAVPGYALANLEVLNHRLTVMPLRTSAMRALGAYANVFAIESFMDEIARALGEDPLALRRRHLDDPRALAVLEAVVARSAWWGAPAGQAANEAHSSTAAIGRGLAWARYKNTGAWCAVIARVQVAEQVRVTHLDLAVDVGAVVDADGVVNQVEGGAVQATSWTLKEQVRFDAEGITSTAWDSYPILRFSEVPEVRVHLLDRPEEPSVGAGEAAQGPVAAAIANAVADALGVRVRTLPLTPDTLLRAVHAADAV